MIESVLDYLARLLEGLTDQAGECALPPVCRVGIYPGPEVPWDVCSVGPSGDGQLWAALQPLVSTPQGSNCVRHQWTATVGVVRCAATLTNDGSPPPVARVGADARQQGRDADILLRAIQCCRLGVVDDETEPTIVSWEPLASGDCVGGQWTIRGVFDACC